MAESIRRQHGEQGGRATFAALCSILLEFVVLMLGPSESLKQGATQTKKRGRTPRDKSSNSSDEGNGTSSPPPARGRGAAASNSGRGRGRPPKRQKTDSAIDSTSQTANSAPSLLPAPTNSNGVATSTPLSSTGAPTARKRGRPPKIPGAGPSTSMPKKVKATTSLTTSTSHNGPKLKQTMLDKFFARDEPGEDEGEPESESSDFQASEPSESASDDLIEEDVPSDGDDIQPEDNGDVDSNDPKRKSAATTSHRLLTRASKPKSTKISATAPKQRPTAISIPNAPVATDSDAMVDDDEMASIPLKQTTTTTPKTPKPPKTPKEAKIKKQNTPKRGRPRKNPLPEDEEVRYNLLTASFVQ
jgi:hypothetical protein